MNKTLKNLIGWVVYLGLLAGLIYGIPKGLAYYLKTEHPMASITSGSMWPALKKGDLILIKGIKSSDEIKIGDIIVYKNPGGFTIHRVEKMEWNGVITKGDANNVADPLVSYKEIIGKTLTFNNKPFRIPMLGNVSILINQNKMNAQ